MQRNKISFKGQKIFVGIDVHKTTWEVAVLTESGFLKRHSQQSSAKVLFDFLRKHYPDGEYHAVYESGFSGFATYYALKELGIECTINCYDNSICFVCSCITYIDNHLVIT